MWCWRPPAGGQPPLDPVSDQADAQTEQTRRFAADPAAQQALASTVKLDTINTADFDTVLYPGGHGPRGTWRSRQCPSP